MDKDTVAIGIGERYITIARMEAKGDLLFPTIMAIEPVPLNIYLDEKPAGEATMVDFLLRLFKDAGVKATHANIVIPDGRSYTRILEMPKLTEKELASAIRFQADQFIPIPIETVSLDLEILHENPSEKKLTILLAATANGTVDKISHIVEKTGLIPESLENESSALLRLIGAKAAKILPPQKPGLVVFINFGTATSTIIVYDPAKMMPIDIISLSIGYDIFFKDLKNNLTVDDKQIEKLLIEVGFSSVNPSQNIGPIINSPEAELEKEISQFIVSNKEKTNQQVSTIYLCGEGIGLKDLNKKLTPGLGLPVTIFNPIGLLTPNNVVDYFKNSLPLFSSVIGECL